MQRSGARARQRSVSPHRHCAGTASRASSPTIASARLVGIRGGVIASALGAASDSITDLVPRAPEPEVVEPAEPRRLASGELARRSPSFANVNGSTGSTGSFWPMRHVGLSMRRDEALRIIYSARRSTSTKKCSVERESASLSPFYFHPTSRLRPLSAACAREREREREEVPRNRGSLIKSERASCAQSALVSVAHTHESRAAPSPQRSAENIRESSETHSRLPLHLHISA